MKDYGRETNKAYGELELFQRALEMGVRGISELISGGNIKNDVVMVDTITFTELRCAINSYRLARTVFKPQSH